MTRETRFFNRAEFERIRARNVERAGICRDTGKPHLYPLDSGSGGWGSLIPDPDGYLGVRSLGRARTRQELMSKLAKRGWT